MYEVTRIIDFCYGHRLLNYLGKCRHLHGHNGRLEITLSAASLDGCGMVVDFTQIKQIVAKWIDENLDHRMILCRDDPAIPALTELGEPVYLLDTNPTAEAIVREIFKKTDAEGFPVIRARLWETPQCSATYVGGDD